MARRRHVPDEATAYDVPPQRMVETVRASEVEPGQAFRGDLRVVQDERELSREDEQGLMEGAGGAQRGLQVDWSLLPEVTQISERGRRSPLFSLLYTREGRKRFLRLLTFVSVGTYHHVVAQSLGISVVSWSNWLERGRKAPSSMYGFLLSQVTIYQAQARMAAELEVRQADPKFWLRHGPAKNDSMGLGWGDATGTEDLDALDETFGSMSQKEVKETDANDLAKLLTVMSELGYVVLTDRGQEVIDRAEESKMVTIDASAEVVPEDNSLDDDEVELEE